MAPSADPAIAESAPISGGAGGVRLTRQLIVTRRVRLQPAGIAICRDEVDGENRHCSATMMQVPMTYIFALKNGSRISAIQLLFHERKRQ